MGETILVVDDDAQVRDVLKRIVESFGYKVVLASDGKDALNKALAMSSLDLVLTDVVMPNQGGFDFIAELAKYRPQVEVIFMSAYTADEKLDEQVADGKARFLAKPFKPSELQRKIQLALL
jgi:CheY-like chemotaxis protein